MPPLHLVALGAIYLLAPTSATVEDDECHCLSQMIYDITRENGLMAVTIVFTDEDEILTPQCIASSRLMERFWLQGVRVNSLHYRPGSHNYESRYHTNVFGVYNNSTRPLLQQANEEGGLLNSQWVMISSPSAQKEIISPSEALNAFIDSQFLIAVYSSCEAEIESPYRVGPKSGVIVEDIGTWNYSDGFRIFSALPHYERRSDFRGYPMNGTGVHVFDFFTTYLSNFGVSGYVGDIITALKNSHNFSLTYKILEGYAYGSLVDPAKGIWNGMVGELQHKRADLTVSELSVIQERSEVISYTQPIYIISRKLFVSTTEDFKKKLIAYSLPMDSILYVTIFFTMVVLSVCLVLTDRLQRRYMPYDDPENPPLSFVVAGWYMLSALLQQGCDTQPKSVSSRTIFWFGFFLSVIAYTSYSATLVSHLAVERPATLPFSNLLELSLQSDWNAGCNENDLFQVTASQTCLNSQTEECRVLRDVWNNNFLRDPDNLVSNYKEGLQKVLKGKYVFIGVGVTTNNYIRQLSPLDACKVKELPGRYLTGGIAIGLQPSSPFKVIFDRSLQKMRENGLMEKLALRYLSATRLCSTSASISAELLDVAALFLILLSGIGAGVAFLTCEIMIWKFITKP